MSKGTWTGHKGDYRDTHLRQMLLKGIKLNLGHWFLMCFLSTVPESTVGTPQDPRVSVAIVASSIEPSSVAARKLLLV